MAAIIGNGRKIFGFDILGRYSGKDVLILMGERSAHYDFEVFTNIFPGLQRENFKIVPGASHWVHADKPKETLEILVSFLNSIDQHKI